MGTSIFKIRYIRSLGYLVRDIIVVVMGVMLLRRLFGLTISLPVMIGVCLGRSIVDYLISRRRIRK